MISLRSRPLPGTRDGACLHECQKKGYCTEVCAIFKEKTYEQVEKRIDMAVDGAEREHSGWADTAYAYIQYFCATQRGRRCTGHEIVDAAIAYGVIQPENRRAWGGPVLRAARNGLLQRVGFTEDPHRPGNAMALWEVK